MTCRTARQRPEFQRQVAEAVKRETEAAKKRSFFGTGPGKLSMTIKDVTFNRNAADECGDISEGESTVTTAGSKEFDYDVSTIATGLTRLRIDVDLEKKTATISGNFLLPVKRTAVVTADKKTTTKVTDEQRDIYTFLQFLPPFSDHNRIVVPIKEEPLDKDLEALGWTGYGYSGSVTIPFTFGKGHFRGNALLSFFVKRVSKKQ